MSLTSHLSRTTDPLSMWMRTRFPMENRISVVKSCRSQLCHATLAVPGRIKKGTKYPYNLIGTALDYRLRLYFEALPMVTVALHGAIVAAEAGHFPYRSATNGEGYLVSNSEPDIITNTPKVINEFFGGLDETMERLAPAGRQIKLKDEKELDRYCLVLGLWEQVLRAGPLINSPLWVPAPKTSAAQMLELATPQMVTDMCQLSRLFFERCGDIVALGSKVVQNPTFEGSSLVGGADGDFIAGGCLWEIKSSIHNGVDGGWIYQLLGYVILDFDDAHRIREIGIYLARQGVRLQWPLQELLDTLTGTTKAEAPPLEERLALLRQDFRAMLRAAAKQQKEDREARMSRISAGSLPPTS